METAEFSSTSSFKYQYNGKLQIFYLILAQNTHDLLKTSQIKSSYFSYATLYSRLSLSRTPRDSLIYFEISVVRHIRFAELRKK